VATSIYEGLESDIRKAVPEKDRRECTTLRRELSDAIQRHLNEVEFWDESPVEAIQRHLNEAKFWDKDPEPTARQRHVAELSQRQILNLYPSVQLLVQSLKEAQQGGRMWPEDEQGPHGFTMWYARLGRRLGSRSCNQLGRRMCRDARFTVAKGQEILAALEPRFRESKKQDKGEKQ